MWSMSDGEFFGCLAFFAVIAGVIGWAVIEAGIWLFSHIHFIWS